MVCMKLDIFFYKYVDSLYVSRGVAMTAEILNYGRLLKVAYS